MNCSKPAIPRPISTHLRISQILSADSRRLTKKTIDIPVLFIQATKDEALPPAMSEGMEEYVTNMTRKSVPTSHWALWEAPEQVNGMVKEWLEKVDRSKSSL